MPLRRTLLIAAVGLSALFTVAGCKDDPAKSSQAAAAGQDWEVIPIPPGQTASAGTTTYAGAMLVNKRTGETWVYYGGQQEHAWNKMTRPP